MEKDITPNDWISSTERRIIGMPTVTAAFYGITGSMQTAVGIACVLLGAILLGTFYFFLRKLSLSRQASVTALLVLCALPANGFRMKDRWSLFVHAVIFVCGVLCISWNISIFKYPLLYKIERKATNYQKDLFGVAGIVYNCGFVELRRSEMPAGHHPSTACGGSNCFI